MELGILVEKMQSKLVLNDQKLEELDSRRKELTIMCEEEQNKISTHCAEVQARMRSAGEALKLKVVKEFAKLDKELASIREKVKCDSLVLCSHFESITKSTERGEEELIDIEECWSRVKDIISSQNDVSSEIPSFHSSKTLAKVKASDLGYLCVAEYQPSQYQLVLSSPLSSLMLVNNNKKAICTVTTSQLFTDMIQANIKFSIKNKSCKETVPFCKEECKLVEDRKSFQICFYVQMPGAYVVTVLLYDQNVSDSPLTIHVTDNEAKLHFNNEMAELHLDNKVKVQEQSMSSKEQSTVKIKDQSSGQTGTSSERQFIQLAVPVEVKVPSTTSKLVSTTPTLSHPLQTPSQVVPLRRPIPPPQVSLPPVSKTNISLTPTPLPPGPLTLSHLTTVGKLTGLRMLSIEEGEGAKPETLHKPIGMCLLHNGNIVVASTFEDKVKMYSPVGQFLLLISSPSPFTRPSDMVTLKSGQFVVRDDTKVQVFSQAGEYMRTLWEDKGKDKCFGLAQDKDDRLVTIMETRRPRKTDLLLFDINTGGLVRKIEMEDIISDKSRSKCRFLTYQLGNLYITDLGLNCVYVLDPTTISVKVFGSSGSGPGQLSDPTGLVVDTVGNMIVADSRNHRLCVFNMNGKFVCKVSLSPEARRPSGVVLDKETRELYVLTLQGRFAMTKYKLK